MAGGILLLTSPSDHLSAHILACSSNAAYILSADKKEGLPFSSPLGLQLTLLLLTCQLDDLACQLFSYC
jgi:hypothetical protein